ncbi:MAG: RNA polymerase sigma factor [Thermoanaerobaculia bacterium]|nr:MAG: RNA polymerase sigma factor [Thermoanaerobaculia bacterium]
MPAPSPAGRDAAVEALVEREGARLLAYLRRSCGDGSDAEDVAQETFARAVRAWDRLQDPDRARAWLYTIARRVCQRLHRRKAGEPARLEPLEALLPRPGATLPDLEPAAAGDPHADRLRAEARELVERALARLPDPFRQTLVLADVAELSLAEIAAVTGVREATVKTRLHRARLKLREVLAAGLPARAATPPAHARRVCLDLLHAKLEAMDRRAPFPYPDAALCERCRSLLGTLDLIGATCSSLAAERVSPELRARIREATAGA